MTEDIQLVPVADVVVLNPRSRSSSVFKELVASIAASGLRRPITVTRSTTAEGATQYHLVCGQGRLQAFAALKQAMIPARIIEASPEDSYLMSLVENLARRNHTAVELFGEIAAMRARNHTAPSVASLTGLSEEYVYALFFLLDNGEERLLNAVRRGTLPPALAMEIARAKDGEVQVALAEAYQRGILPGKKLLAVRRIVEERNARGKTMLGRPRAAAAPRQPVTAESLVRAYTKETDKQKRLIKRANIANTRLLFLVTAMRTLLADTGFQSLLRDEGLGDLPEPLSDRLEGLAT